MRGDSKLTWTIASTGFWLSSAEVKVYATTGLLVFFHYLVFEIFHIGMQCIFDIVWEFNTWI